MEETNKKPGFLFSSTAEEVFEWLETIIFYMFSAIIVFGFIFRLSFVDGSSMVPTLHDNDKLVLFHYFYTPKPGDIVVLNAPILEKAIVKRVIATEGQEVMIDFESGAVSVDGKVLDEPYIAETTRYDGGAFVYPVTVPEDSIFVMGDNRNQSTDSRFSEVGFVDNDQIIGKVLVRYFPLDAIGPVK